MTKPIRVGVLVLIAVLFSCDDKASCSSQRISFPLPVSLQVTVNGPGRVSGGGIDCPPTCNMTVVADTDVTLTAHAAEGSAFGVWDGDCYADGDSCVVSMSGDSSVWAWFWGAPEATLVVVNNLCMPITEIRIDGVAQDMVPIAVGSSATIATGIRTGYHAVEAIAEDGAGWGEWLELTRGEVTWTLDNPGVCLKLINNTGYAINHWYMAWSPDGCTSAEWPTDLLLVGGVVPSGSTYVASVGSGTIDSEAVSDEAHSWRLCSRELVAGTTVVWEIE